MSEIKIDRYRTCAVSGHRVLFNDIDEKKLKTIFSKLTELNFDTFLIGMALGFDTLCFHILEEIRKTKKIRIIACIPCPSQANKFNLVEREEYDRMLESADERVIVSPEYTDYCMQKRNEYMVDRASCIIVYKRHEYGGTFNTVRYALRKQVPIIEV